MTELLFFQREREREREGGGRLLSLAYCLNDNKPTQVTGRVGFVDQRFLLTFTPVLKIVFMLYPMDLTDYVLPESILPN